MTQALPFTSAEAIALTRLLYPAVTEALASDVFLGAWYDWACSQVNLAWGYTEAGVSYALTGVAMLLAHRAYRSVAALGAPSPGGGLGPVTSVSTLSLSAGWAAPGPGVAPSDADLMTTQPGIDFYGLRMSRAVTKAPRVVGSLPRVGGLRW